MKKYLVSSLLAVAVALSSSAFAADQGAAKPEKAAEVKIKTHAFTGEITAVDAKANSLTVKKKDESKTFKTEGAKVRVVGKEDATLADLKVGDKVLVVSVEENGALVAKKIGPVPAKKPKAEKKAAVEKKAE
jgi:Cu/Ag efflux protein CusF